MSKLREIEEKLSELTSAEKAQLLQSVVRELGDAFPGIQSTLGVCGGEPCIVRTRIPVWLLEQARRLGTSEADLLKIYPTLRAEDLVNAWAYVRSHRKHFIHLHNKRPGHSGVVVCTFDPDFQAQARRIHQEIESKSDLKNRLIR